MGVYMGGPIHTEIDYAVAVSPKVEPTPTPTITPVVTPTATPTPTIEPCPCWFRVRAEPKSLELSAANPTGVFNLVLDPASTCAPTSYEMKPPAFGFGLFPIGYNLTPPVGDVGAGFPGAVTITWDNPCEIGISRTGTIILTLRGPCRVQTLKMYVSFVCGPFGDFVYDVSSDCMLSPEVDRVPEGVHQLEPDEPFTPIVGVRNVGLEPMAEFPVTCTIKSGETVIYDEMMWVEELLPPGEATDVIFPELTPERGEFALPEGDYYIIFQTWLEGDMNPLNDVIDAGFVIEHYYPEK